MGAPGASPGGRPGAGSVFIFDGAGGPVQRFDGVDAEDAFGESLACCDIDGDGDPDLIVGAPFASPAGLSEAGSVYFFSAPGFFAVGRLDGEETGATFGDEVLCCDLEGDCVREVAIAATYRSDLVGSPAPGSVFFFGRDGLLLCRLDGETPGDQYGDTLACCDLDGDGFQEFLVAAEEASPFGIVGAGAVYVYSGRNFRLRRRLAGSFPGEGLGQALACCPDRRGDRDLVVTAEEEGKGAGALYVFTGDTFRLRLRRRGRNLGDEFGTAAIWCEAGRALRPRITVGAEGFGGGAGRVYQYDSLGSLVRSIRAPEGAAHFGDALLCCDWDRDGVPDIVVGAEGEGGIDGQIFVYSGRFGRLLARFNGAGGAG